MKRKLKRQTMQTPQQPQRRNAPVAYEREPGAESPVIQPVWLDLQRALGNRTTQQMMVRHGGQASFGLDKETALRLTQQYGGATPALAVDALHQVQRQAAKRGPAKPTNGAVTIKPPVYDYYDVTGQTLDQVNQQLDPEEWGSCAANYDYSYAATGGSVTRVDLTVSLTIRLPRWKGKGWQQASPAARKEWERMLQALRTHEDGHVDIARQQAPLVRDRLRKTSEAGLELEAEKARSDAQTENDKYDDRTQHGQTQGVALDLSIS
jgi:predicted secreted Zn-dependent protease